VSEFHVFDDLGGAQHGRPCTPRHLVPAGEEGDPTGRGQSTLQLDGPADVAGVALAAGFLDVGADCIELPRQGFDVLCGEVCVSLDVRDGHRSSS
jgi:hypothetical protein